MSALTIGELAKRANVSTSLLRFYEKEKLLLPSGRTDSGYRLYAPEAERTLRFIRSAQRYGFSLSDIKLIVSGEGDDGSVDLVDMAQQRFLEIERRLTEMLVLRHELELFLDDMAAHVDQHAEQSMAEHYRELVEQVCDHDHHARPTSPLSRLAPRLNCNLDSAGWDEVFDQLRGHHVHIWREDDTYNVLYSCDSSGVRVALQRIVEGEADCGAHSPPDISNVDGGILFRATGDNAFLYAQLFLALESSGG